MKNHNDLIVVTMDIIPNKTIKEVCGIVQAGTIKELRQDALSKYGADAIVGLSKQYNPSSVYGDFNSIGMASFNYKINTSVNYMGTAVKLD